MEYQLPRLTKMWTHLERQSGGQVKGMGEKQIEVDKRILRNQVSKHYYTIILKVIHMSMNIGFVWLDQCTSLILSNRCIIYLIIT